MANNTPNRPDENIRREDAGAEIFDDVQEAQSEVNSTEDEENELINGQAGQIDTLNETVQKLTEEVEKAKKDYLYLMAEFDNFRKRTVKEKSDILRNASEKDMADLLPIVDDFERGIEANRTTDDVETLRQGMELIYQKFVKYLERHGVKPIESTGLPFDPEMHEAIAMVPVPDESQKGKVIDTPTKGYTINDKVLRHAKVAVGQ
ncbi:MAG: nucleotide exchange factor GrpE [Bacteroides sp.]|nr:nucleotide exchange factor GrpE [Bacteroidales bacterium]MBD5250328.1 nucleotide exchange factor GrpE [Barnesiella sp.]MBD5253567.1 nucleotide exchange factor GrpE [Barnesiella sp.]MBD5368772.1 nucleotide exchange factor GrpE [Bacteroides sp.]